MLRPLDHITVIQQINFAERIHQNQQTHPEISKLQAEVIQQEQRNIQRRQTQCVHKTVGCRIHLHQEGYYTRVGRKIDSSAGNTPSRIDLKA